MKKITNTNLEQFYGVFTQEELNAEITIAEFSKFSELKNLCGITYSNSEFKKKGIQENGINN